MLFALGLPGCISTYAPPSPVAPLLDEAGDVSVRVNARAFAPTQGANAYVAAAPSKATRLYVAGSLARERGGSGDDYEGRTLRERNHTNQIEAGGGYGHAGRRYIVEALAGAGYGRTRSAQCERKDLFEDQPEWCRFWADSRSWFVRPFAQVNAALHVGPWQGGGGIRASMIRYQFEELFSRPSERVIWVPTF